MWDLAFCVSALKLLFIPTYRSTDFEVHRNWLAITNSLPLHKWYIDETSEWTLDYPPFFAWFEFALSYIAKFFDDKMLILNNLNYASTGTILFQRLSVIVTDFVFIYAVKEYCDYLFKEEKVIKDLSSLKYKIFILLISNFGLLLVDHIHFQYNGFLYGILILSIVRISQMRYLEGAVWFAILLNLKHIYLYVAPVYFIYLLRNYCFTARIDISWRSFSPTRFLSLGFVVIATFAASFGPFIYHNQLLQVLSRLFPFKRGLCHAYWAPNFWALYNVADKLCTVSGTKLGIWHPSSNGSTASMTGGLVQEFNHAVLPSISPTITLILTAFSIVPCVLHLWRYGWQPADFIRGIVLCGFSSYMFGWHVHEKAILLVIIPLILLCVEDCFIAKIVLLLSTVGHYSLFPLIFTQFETPVKYCGMAVYTIFMFSILHSVHRSEKARWKKRLGLFSSLLPSSALVNPIESLYLIGILPLELYNNCIHYHLTISKTLPFLPLLLTSSYCAVGVSYCYVRLYWNTISSSFKSDQFKKSYSGGKKID